MAMKGAESNNAEYWARRMKLLGDALADQGFAYVQNLEQQFDRAIAQIEKEIAAWYQRFAVNNSITYSQARKWLTTDELSELRWTVEDYIRYAQENELSGAWREQLENASAKMHISRLDALKLELQQQIERLAGGQLDGIDALARRIYTEGYYRTAFEVQRGLGVGWTLHALNERTVAKVLARPWTTDGRTFSDRVWANKAALLGSVNQHLTQMIIRGEDPRKTTSAIAHDMGVSKSKAGRLAMTESAYFSSVAQKDCFCALGVEQYVVASTLDTDTCDICGDMDGKVFKMSEYEAGLTAPPFHPWCRCCTAPWYEDMQGLGERAARDADGNAITVPREMTYRQWREEYVKDRPKYTVEDVTAEYTQSATPGQGTITYGEGYKKGKHIEEVDVASWLHSTYGGDIELLNESDAAGIKMPDYNWRGKLWELKKTSTFNATDNQVRKAIKQIQNNPGGIILDYGDADIDTAALVGVITCRAARSSTASMDVIIRAKGTAQTIIRFKRA